MKMTVSEIIFKLNNKFFTNIDLKIELEYIARINNLNPSKFNEFEKKEILRWFYIFFNILWILYWK